MTVRVLVYSPVNPGDGGGVQTVVRRLVAALRARGHHVTHAWGRPDPDGGAELTLRLPLLVWRGGVPAPRALLQAVGALARLAIRLARLRPQIVNVHFVTAEALYFFLLRPVFRYRVVLSVHGSDVLRPKPWNASIVPRLLPRADAVTTVSRLTESHVRGLPGVGAQRVAAIPNGIDHAFWQGGPEMPPLADRAPLVLAVGRLHPVKGQDVLLHAVAAVRARVPGVRVLFAGDGGHRAQLEQLARELGLDRAVEFAGTLDAAALRARMREARLFVLPSRSEGLPLALLEAMAAGLPVVATDVGGVPEVLTPGTGVVCPPEDPGALGEAVARLLTDGDLAAGLAAQGRARAAEFAVERTEAAYEEIFLRTAGLAPDDIGPRRSSRQS